MNMQQVNIYADECNVFIEQENSDGPNDVIMLSAVQIPLVVEWLVAAAKESKG